MSLQNSWNVQQGWLHYLRRNFNMRRLRTRVVFMDSISRVQLTTYRDCWVWNPNPKGSFTTKSLANDLNSSPADSVTPLHEVIWADFYPKNIEFFLWEISHCAINTCDKTSPYHQIVALFVRHTTNLPPAYLSTAILQTAFGRRLLNPLSG